MIFGIWKRTAQELSKTLDNVCLDRVLDRKKIERLEAELYDLRTVNELQSRRIEIITKEKKAQAATIVKQESELSVYRTRCEELERRLNASEDDFK